jgi:hypothetical protein
MDFSTSTISNTIDKGSIAEDMSLYRASMEDAENRLRDKGTPEAISNEIIQEGDEILNTYQVTSAAIHGGMGSVWRVQHRNWNVDLAMKRPQPRFFAEGGVRKKEAFVAECDKEGYEGRLSLQISFRDCILTPDRWIFESAAWINEMKKF